MTWRSSIKSTNENSRNQNKPMFLHIEKDSAGPISSATHFVRLLLTVSVLAGTGFTANAASPYRMEGIVTNVDTMLPVANATAEVLITSELDFAKRIRKSTTDDDGHYSIEVPVGHAMCVGPDPPPGYYAVDENATAAFATTPEKPVFTKNYLVRKGQSIHVIANVTDGSKIPQDTFVSLAQQHGKNVRFGSCELDTAGQWRHHRAATFGQFHRDLC